MANPSPDVTVRVEFHTNGRPSIEAVLSADDIFKMNGRLTSPALTNFPARLKNPSHQDDTDLAQHLNGPNKPGTPLGRILDAHAPVVLRTNEVVLFSCVDKDFVVDVGRDPDYQENWNAAYDHPLERLVVDTGEWIPWLYPQTSTGGQLYLRRTTPNPDEQKFYKYTIWCGGASYDPCLNMDP